jgi:hypothetical protein
MEDITGRAPARNNFLLACSHCGTSARSAIRDREWLATEAARTGTDWPGLVVTAFEMMVAAGIIEPEPNTNAPRSTTMANSPNSRKGISR